MVIVVEEEGEEVVNELPLFSGAVSEVEVVVEDAVSGVDGEGESVSFPELVVIKIVVVGVVVEVGGGGEGF